MASKRSTDRKSSGGKRRRSFGSVNEPVAARALQALILVAGVGLLLAVFLGTYLTIWLQQVSLALTSAW